MNAQTERFTLQGGAGAIEALRDHPVGAPKGVAVIAHPHPLYAGTMDNKVVQTLARAFVQSGWVSVRFNFRGVGASAGCYDEGNGEAQDLLEVVRQVAPAGALAIAGFSFGAFVSTRVVDALWHEGRIEQVVLVGTATSRFEAAALPASAHMRTLMLHGEKDDVVPLESVMEWARPQALPITVVPGGGHFFHGQLPLLKSLVMRHLSVVHAN